MTKKIIYNNQVFAIIFKKEEALASGHNFLTDESNNLQVGIIAYPKGYIIPNHFHFSVERNIIGTQEMLYVESGKIKVIFLTEEGNKINEEILESGDLVVLIKGGHGMEFLEDSTKIIYTKQGPYVSKEKDKKVF
jgi:anti-sigma factor ChrR (cupin superfamily)